MFGVRLDPTVEPKEKSGDPRDDAYAFLRAVVTEAIETERLRPDLRDTEVVANVLWSAVHGIVSLQIDHFQGPHSSLRKAREITALMLDVLIRGMSR